MSEKTESHKGRGIIIALGVLLVMLFLYVSTAGFVRALHYQGVPPDPFAPPFPYGGVDSAFEAFYAPVSALARHFPAYGNFLFRQAEVLDRFW